MRWLLHVEERLKPGIEAVIGDLIPELFEFSFVDGVTSNVTPTSKCTEQLSGKFFGVFVHSYKLEKK